MKAQSLVNEIRRRGGTASIVMETTYRDGAVSYCKSEVIGSLNGYEVHMHDLENSYFTVRAESKSDTYDPGSDYNPGGYDFCHRLKELDYYASRAIAA